MSSEEREKLITDNIKLVYLVINKLNLGKELEEYIDLGMIGLCHGVDSYDATKGYAISTYLYRCISNEILMYFRKKRPSCISLDNDINDDSTGYDIIQDDTDVEEECLSNEKKEIMYSCISMLSEEEQFIINRLFGLNGCSQTTQKEVGKMLNTTQAQISSIKNVIVEKLKEMAKEKYK